MVAPDWQVLDRTRYEFTYVRREFLGESRCFVFDVKPMRDGKCVFADYGPDCLPCTDDDLVKGTTEINPTTTGSAEAALFDANPPNGAIIDKDQNCFGSPCMTQVNGSLFDCSQLGPGTSGGLSGGSLGVCFTTLDAAQIGDNVTCTVFSSIALTVRPSTRSLNSSRK